jgi:putative ABC transport system permease protein
MFKNYIKIAWRNLIRNKVYSTINIMGLAIGLAVCMLIVLYVGHEFSYDKFHDKADRLYQVQSEIKMGNDPIYMPYMGYSDAAASKEKIPSVEDFMRYRQTRENVIVQNPESPSLKFAEGKFLMADSNFFNFFSFPLVHGDKDQVLLAPFSVVLSKKAAEKYFGKQNPIGKTIRYNNEYDFTVTGIAENVPSNSSIDYDFVASLSSMATMDGKKEFLKDNGPDFSTYLLLKESADIALVEAGLLEINKIKGEDGHMNLKYLLKPLTEVHLNENAVNIRYIKIFPLVALLILLLALLNYASLSTARSTTRSKEIGVRKVLGANRKTIAVQFFIESALYTIIAFALGYLLCAIIQPYFFDFLQISMDVSFLYSLTMLVSFAVLFIITVLLAGLYPSFLLSAYKPVMVLYGKLSNQNSGIGVRKFFTVFQFAMSVILIICGIVIDRQLYFLRHTETGVDTENIVMIPFEKEVGSHFIPFKQEIQSLPAVKQSSVSLYPMYSGYNIQSVKRQNSDEMVFLPTLTVDQNFISLLALKWQAPPSDSLFYRNQKLTAIINQAAVEKLNLDSNPINQKINGQHEIQGVLKDFNFTSLHNKIDPLCLFVIQDNDVASSWAENGGCIFAKINSKVNMPTVIQHMKTIYEKYDTESPFEYHFMDDAFEAQYASEDRLAKIFGIFTALTILIAAMGLFGLATFMALQRRKEIGIRKVLGASVKSITTLLSKDFLKLVLIAIVLAVPISWYFMDDWLQNFAYRITISWWVFFLAGLLALVIAFLTVSFQAIKAAMANPVKSLRTE